MTVLEDRIAYLQRYPVRLEIARLCRDKPLTKEQIAKRLKRPSGGLSAPKTMKEDGVLVSAGGTKGQGKRGGGIRFRLSKRWRAALDACLAAATTGSLVPGGDILLLQASAVQRALSLLREEDKAVTWGAPLVGERLGLLLFVPGSTTESEVIGLISRLADRDVDPIRLHIPRTLNATALREWAADIAGD